MPNVKLVLALFAEEKMVKKEVLLFFVNPATSPINITFINVSGAGAILNKI